jgi:hypothetical protein
MEPNKLDNQIKEKLDSRTIQPSAQAWDRLEVILNAAEKPKRSYSWLYIAANFVGFLLIATVFFSQSEALIDPDKTNSIIQNPILLEKDQVSMDEIDKKNTSNKKDAMQSVSAAGIVSQKQFSKGYNKAAMKQEVLIIKKENTENQVVQNAKAIINQKNEQIANSEIRNASNVDANLQLLLLEQSANKVIASRNSSIQVNANKLLAQLDNELQLSFMGKVMSKVNKNYQLVKVVVNNRNLE